MNETIFEILRIAVCAIISIVIVVFARVVKPYIESLRMNEEQQVIMTLVDVAVRSAEQLLRERGQGRAKKAQVVAFVSQYLKEKGINITEEQLDRLIESSVYILKCEQKERAEE